MYLVVEFAQSIQKIAYKEADKHEDNDDDRSSDVDTDVGLHTICKLICVQC